MPNEIRENPQAMAEVQQQLLQQDVFLIGRHLQDAADLAPQATITASSETTEGPAVNVISGQNRAMQESRGIPQDRVVEGTHRWISEASDQETWIELRWSEPVALKRIELVFDTGLHRQLTLTQSDAYCAKMCWGTGQPEVVKHYEVQCEADGEWSTIARESQQWQRRASHSLAESKTCSALRIRVRETWGTESARIVRIGAFA